MRSRKRGAGASPAAEVASVPADGLASIERLVAALAKERIAAAGGTLPDSDAEVGALAAELERLATVHMEAEGEEEGEEEAADGEEAGGEEDDSTAVVMSELEAKHEVVMQELQVIKEQHGGGDTKHDFGRPANRGQTCGVCSSVWEPECGWEKGNGCWACFACQVYICSWECLNTHNREGSGNTVRGASVIYKTKEEFEAAKAAPEAAGKGKRKS